MKASRKALLAVAIMSATVNILALTGSFYMLQVYDRVLTSHSVPTLIGLTGLMLLLYAIYGVLDNLRNLILGRLGLRLDRALRGKVFEAITLAPLRIGNAGDGMQPVRDLDQLRHVLAGPGLMALFDAPWLPFYLGLVYMLHPWLGLLATAGVLILVGLTFLTERKSQAPSRAVAISGAERSLLADAARRNAEVVRANGLGAALQRRWGAASERYITDSIASVEATSGFATSSRVFRMVLQSLMLGLGALVVLKGEATGGVIIAASILGGRALAPIEIAITHWRNIVSARHAHERLAKALAALPDERDRMELPAPSRRLEVQDLFVAAPGEQRPIVQGASFALSAGDGLGIVGPSAAGKSSLVRALVGAWTPVRGRIRLDGAALDQWRLDDLGRHIGYLPQDIEIFDGTIAENIARLEEEPDPAKVIAAATAAGVHDMVLAMPQGYNTRVGRGGSSLSAGQRQRIALARALFGDPFLVVLDEPNSNLDHDGDTALAQAIASIRARNGIVIVVTHRPTALAGLDKVLMLGAGQVQAFGPRDEVIARVIQQVPPGAGPNVRVVPTQAAARGAV